MTTRPLSPLFRQAQQDALQYKGGALAIAAVPGSGKTFTLAHMAARLVSRLSKTDLSRNREILVVTFTNSAVNSLRWKIAQILQRDRGLLPYIGYRVRTLHGLAHDIVRERPSLLGLAEDFRIVDEQATHQIIRELAENNLRNYGNEIFQKYISPDLLNDERQLRRIQSHDLPEIAVQISGRFIKYCKDSMMTPGDFYASDALESHALARFCLRIYDDYQRSLAYRGAVDFDDLVRLALVALRENGDYLERLQERWTYVLEDEAQDSSLLQEQMLTLLTAKRSNWVRVGDPNQAINTTFTTADPRFLRGFVQRADQVIELTQSGRSGRPISDLANALLRWTTSDHPIVGLRQSFDYRLIEPTLPGDPQPNPPTDQTLIHLGYEPGKTITPDQELEVVVRSLQGWLSKNRDQTIAVLVPENSRGFKLIDALQQQHVPCEELLRSTASTREVAAALNAVLSYLASPLDTAALVRLYVDVWWGWSLGREALASHADHPDVEAVIAAVRRLIARQRTIEGLLWPVDEDTWAEQLGAARKQAGLDTDLRAFRGQIQRWQRAAVLPVDQLMLTVAQDVFRDPADLALTHKLALSLRNAQEINPEWRLKELAQELLAISENERRFVGIEGAASGYEPRPGVVTVATIHAAKGLEWDRVYLLSVNNYSFPSALPEDQFISEKWFVRDHLNLEAETLAQVDALRTETQYVEGQASLQARVDYAAERLRLLYVGITRARRELIIFWNIGRYAYKGGQMICQPALPLIVLTEYLAGTRILKE